MHEHDIFAIDMCIRFPFLYHFVCCDFCSVCAVPLFKGAGVSFSNTEKKWIKLTICLISVEIRRKSVAICRKSYITFSTFHIRFFAAGVCFWKCATTSSLLSFFHLHFGIRLLVCVTDIFVHSRQIYLRKALWAWMWDVCIFPRFFVHMPFFMSCISEKRFLFDILCRIMVASHSASSCLCWMYYIRHVKHKNLFWIQTCMVLHNKLRKKQQQQQTNSKPSDVPVRFG